MNGWQKPSLNLAHLALLPKQPWQRAFPVLQSTRSQPRTGTVTWMTPPVQPSQQPPSRTAKGVFSMAMLYRGRWSVLAEVMQTRGSCLSQVWSPSKGLQLLQEKRPAQLFLKLGQIVACKVRPFLIGLRLYSLTLEMPPQSTALAQQASASTSRMPLILYVSIIIQKKLLRTKKVPLGERGRGEGGGNRRILKGFDRDCQWRVRDVIRRHLVKEKLIEKRKIFG